MAIFIDENLEQAGFTAAVLLEALPLSIEHCAGFMFVLAAEQDEKPGMGRLVLTVGDLRTEPIRYYQSPVGLQGDWDRAIQGSLASLRSGDIAEGNWPHAALGEWLAANAKPCEEPRLARVVTELPDLCLLLLRRDCRRSIPPQECRSLREHFRGDDLIESELTNYLALRAFVMSKHLQTTQIGNCVEIRGPDPRLAISLNVSTAKMKFRGRNIDFSYFAKRLSSLKRRKDVREGGNNIASETTQPFDATRRTILGLIGTSPNFGRNTYARWLGRSEAKYLEGKKLCQRFRHRLKHIPAKDILQQINAMITDGWISTLTVGSQNLPALKLSARGIQAFELQRPLASRGLRAWLRTCRRLLFGPVS